MKLIQRCNVKDAGTGITVGAMLILTLMAASADALAGEPAFLNTAQMAVVRQQLHDHRAAPQTAEAYQHLLAAADSALKKPELSVTDKGMTPPGGSKHDYLSLSAYWWPDESKSDGLPWIRNDGHVNPASKNDQSDGVRLADFTARVQNLTLAWYFSGEQKYADKAVSLLRTWFITPETRMNPNLNFAQGVPGISPGRNAGVLDGRYFSTRIVDSLVLLRGDPAWTDNDEQQMRAWMQAYLRWLQGSKIAKKEGRTENNHGNWYVTQVSGIAWYLGDNAVIGDMAKLMKSKLDVQLKPDGTQPAELARTRSFHYSYFNLQAISMMAVLAQKNGIDLWHYKTPQGGSMLTSLDFMARFTDPAVPWPYKSLDQIRVRPVPLLSWADNATGEKRYEQYIRSAKFTLPPAVKPASGGYHEDVTRGAVMEAERDTWLLSLPSFAAGYVAPQPPEVQK
ncbi:alginate lyase family protein [Rahnella perminowiae]|uniref:alginate lyase family protein n=1 Tax=Rahnella perminowiae TaxID=2816244 RepID=UPI001C26A9BE|nr:alginate lyase family protein [Rahnella perminowiae]MBU9828216.1 alginate lyase family protein [Rahnella perminowiae]